MTPSLAFQSIDLGGFSTLLGVVALLATVAGVAWYAFRVGKSKAEEDKIKPFKEAADGWERVARQQEAELKIVRSQLTDVQGEYDELKQDYETAMRLNMRLQGSVDTLTSRVAALEEVVRILRGGGNETTHS